MTLILELDAEQQARLETLAVQAGQTPEDYLRAMIGTDSPPPQPTPEGRAALLALRGKYPGLRSVDEFIRAKREETEREDTKFDRLRAGL